MSASRFKLRAPLAWNSLRYGMVRLSSLAKFKTAIKEKLYSNDEAFFDRHCKILLLSDFTMTLF